MKVSAKTNYACLAMLELASQYETKSPVRIREIAQRHDVPPRFLVQILLQLKKAGLIASTRGAAGGYQMNKPPEEVSLGDVVAAVATSAREGAEGKTEGWPSPAAEILTHTWRQVTAVEQEMLQGIPLTDLLKQIRGKDEGMYYI